MNLSDIPLFAALKGRMHWLSANQQVIAENVSNANTPGYTPSQLKEQDFGALVDQIDGNAAPTGTAMKRTQVAHMGASGEMAGSEATRARDDEVFERVPNGNAVTLEDQLVDMANTQMEYTAMLGLYRKHIAMLRTALGRNSG